MSKIHELTFKIQGIVDNKLNSNFEKVNSNISKMSSHLNKLEKKKLDLKKYENLTQSINKTSDALKHAQSNLEPLRKKFKEFEVATSALRVEWGKAEKKVDDLAMAIAKSTNPTKEMRSELAVAKLEAKKLKDEFKSSESATKTLGNEFKSVDREVKNLENSLSSQKRQLDGVSGALGAAAGGSVALSKSQKQLENQIRRTKDVMESYDKVKKNWDTTKSRFGDFMKTGAMMTGAVAVPIKFAMDSESTMADVNKMVDFESALEKQNFEKAMRKKLGTELPLTFQEYGELIANAAGAGIEKGAGGKNLLEFAEDAAKMAVAFDIEGGQAGEMMAKWRAAFAMNQEEVIGLADQINYLGDNSAAKSSEISNMVSKVGALGGVAGLTAADVSAIGTAMVSMGVDSDMGATAIKKMSTSLTKGASSSKKAQEYFKKMGLTSAQVAQDMQSDAQSTIVTVLEGIKGLDEVEQTSALREIFGEVSIGAIAPLLQNIDQLEKYFDLVDENKGQFKGSMNKEFEIRSDTAENQWAIMKNNLSSIASMVGNSLLPVFVQLSEEVVKVAQKFQEWAAANPELLNLFVRGTVLLGGLILAGKGIGVVISLFKTFGSVGRLAFGLIKIAGSGSLGTIKLIWSAIKTASGLFLKFGGIIKGPIMAVVKGLFTLWKMSPIGLKIAAIIAIALLLHKNWKKIMDFFGETLKSLQNWFGDLGDKIGGVVDKVKGFADGIKGLGSKVWGFLTGTNDRLNTAQSSSRALSRTATNRGASYEAYAKGGVVTKPHLALVGEGGYDETIIPHDGSKNAQSLWTYAGQQLGLLSKGPSNSRGHRASTGNNGGNIFEIHYQVSVNGGDSSNIKAQVEAALDEANPRLIALLKSLISDMEYRNKRVAFAS